MKFEGKLTGLSTIILAGGKGTRLVPYTTVLPKPLMPIDEMPILEIIIRQLRQSGILDITLSVGYLASLLKAYFGDGSRWGVAIHYSCEDEPLGTAGPLTLVSGLTDTFLVMNGDLLTTLDYAAMVRFHQEREAIVTVGLFKKEVKIDLGIIEIANDNHISGYQEKPVLSYEVSMGVYVMEPLALHYIPTKQRFDLPDLIKRLITERQPVIGYHFDGYWLDIGRQEDYPEAIGLFQRERTIFLPGEG